MTIAGHQTAVRGKVIGEEGAEPFHVIAPIAMKFAGRAKPCEKLAPRRAHSLPCGVAGRFIKGTRGVGDDEYLKPLFASRQGGEGYADLGDDSGDNELLLASRFHGFDEVFVVPRIDLPGAGDAWSIGKDLLELWHQRTVGAGFKARGEDHREVEILRGVGQRENVVLKLVGGKVMHEIGQSGLVIYEEDGDVVFIEAMVFEVAHDGVG